MLDQFEKGLKVSKAEFEEQVPQLRVDLLNAQDDLLHADFSVLVLLAGDDREGINELAQRLHEWMDARYLVTRAFGTPTDEERQRPRTWRYWRDLPRQGRIGLYLGGWAHGTIGDRVLGNIGKRDFERAMEHGNRIEQALADDGTLVLKYFLHISEKELKKRVKADRKNRSLDERDREMVELSDDVIPIAEPYLETTSAPVPWTIVESTNGRHRDLQVARSILGAVQQRLAEPWKDPPLAVPRVPNRDFSALADIDLSAELSKDDYDERLEELQREVRQREAKMRASGTTTVLVFEGWDAGGKGGAIRRVT